MYTSNIYYRLEVKNNQDFSELDGEPTNYKVNTFLKVRMMHEDINDNANKILLIFIHINNKDIFHSFIEFQM